jgi:hypothetical protein
LRVREFGMQQGLPEKIAAAGNQPGLKHLALCAVLTPVVGSMTSGNNGSLLTPPAMILCLWSPSRRIRSYALVDSASPEGFDSHLLHLPF